jgi:hypothetical protein
VDWVAPRQRNGAQNKSEAVQAQHDGVISGSRDD